MTAVLFTLLRPGDAAVVGLALVAPEARYCSLRARGAERLDRRFATPADWKEIEHDVASLPSGPLPAVSAIARVVASDCGLAVQYVTVQAIAAQTICD